MNKAYNRINWENYPSLGTPLNEQNLNRMDGSLDEIDNRVISLDTTKSTKEEVAPLIKEISFNERNGIFTITRKNGSKFTIDTKLEKIAINFGYDPATQKISLTLIDGTVQYIDLSALITQYEFMDTDTVSFFVDTNGKISAIVKEGSIEEKHLRPNYLAEIKVEAAKAQLSEYNAAQSAVKAGNSEKLAESYTHGGTGVREGEDDDNAQKYKELAEQAYENLKKSNVTGVKGAAEPDYRQGNISLSPEDIGAFPDVATIGADGDDLDTKKTSGIWLYTLNRKPAVCPGTDGRGWLFVMEGTSSLVKQIWYQYGANAISADTYVRTCKSDGTWSPWAKYAMEDDVLSVPKLIPNTADLDTYRTPGFYYSVGGNSISHKPDRVNNFALLVLRNGNTARKQVVYPGGTSAASYAYYRDDNTGNGYEADWHGVGSEGVTAEEVVYDNSESGMAADNVQGAIDALDIELDEHIENAVRHIDKEERTAWNGKLDSTGDASNVAVNFSQASTRANLISKEKLSVSLGKIMKWFADLANGAASTLLGYNLTANRALVSNGSGKVAVSSVTATELGYLDGVTSGIQQQLNGLKISESSFLTWYGVTMGLYRYGRIGKIATISGTLSTDLKAYTKYTLGTIASGFRPLNQLTKVILIQGDVQAMLNITREGAVELTPYATLAKGYVPLIAEMYEIS